MIDLADGLAAARMYRSLGLNVLPVAPRGKAPHSLLLPLDAAGEPSWAEYARRAASDAELRSWFETDPECNLGIMTGSASNGVVVADFDRDGPGVPPTAMVRTHGGRHAYFTSKIALQSGPQPWGDFKAEGGYVVAPPSVHPEGTPYRWWEMLELWDTDLAPVPPWLLRDVRVANSTGRRPREIETAGRSGDGVGVARNSVSCFFLPVGSIESANGLLELCTTAEVALKLMRRCGCTVKEVGSSFLCPLPGHEEKHPSASLWHQPGRPIRLRCFHEHEWWALPDLFAIFTTGKLRRLGRGERALWWLRALDELDIARPGEIVCSRLPGGAPAAARKLYEGFHYALRLRTLYQPGQAGMPFSWRFAAHWCGIGSQATVSRGMKWLLGHGYLRKLKPQIEGIGAPCQTTLLALGSGPVAERGR